MNANITQGSEPNLKDVDIEAIERPTGEISAAELNPGDFAVQKIIVRKEKD